jgi:hypothetical protein
LSKIGNISWPAFELTDTVKISLLATYEQLLTIAPNNKSKPFNLEEDRGDVK